MNQIQKDEEEERKNAENENIDKVLEEFLPTQDPNRNIYLMYRNDDADDENVKKKKKM